MGFAVSQAGFRAAHGFRSALAGLGLEPRQFGLLNHVAAAEGQSQQALAAALHLPPSRMVAIVDELEEQGLVQRRPNPDDRRARALFLTPKGRRTLDRARACVAEHEAGFVQRLTPTEQDQLVALLGRLTGDDDLPPGVHPGLVYGDGA